MIFEGLIFITTFILFYYLYTYRRLHVHFKERGVKYLPGVPLFGNMLQSSLQKRHFLEDLDEVYQAFPDEKYVGFFELTLPVVLVRDPEIIKSIVVKDFDHFTDHREFFSEESDPLFAGSLLLMKGKKWRHMRSTLSPAFTASKMKYMMPFVVDLTHNVLEYLDAQQGKDVDVDDLFRRYTNDVIASAGFGLQVNSIKDRDNEFYNTGHGIFDFDLRQRMLLMLVTQFPELGKRLGFRFFTEKIYNFFSSIVATTMEYRRRENIERPDMIQLLMEAKKDWTPGELASQVFIFFTAGFETTASSLVLTIHELALNTDVQEKLYQHCKKFSEEKEFTFENMSELKYLDAVINESLRKWSPAIIFDRTCTKTYELPPPREGGKPYVIKPGEALYNLVDQVQMDPKYWPEPHKFDPERFSEENKHKIKPFTFMPFGVGPRACIGLRFALMEIRVALYHVILNYRIVKTEKTMDPITMLPHNINIQAKDGTNVRFEKR
ncbi:putative cytochrome P450 9f2 [Anticarsia gemmatalis]|uniref:putative cytochrome P450 9f2 n=1 Tax=Anticarsia gemmatalis TaxID=129554 RepID=UPI003F76AAE9